jgi:hypothetical protein
LGFLNNEPQHSTHGLSIALAHFKSGYTNEIANPAVTKVPDCKCGTGGDIEKEIH